MLNKVFIGLGVLAGLVLLFLIVVAMQPADFRISRSAKMAAAPAEVFAQVNDFHKWDAWSPWAKLDPNAKVTYEGEPAGKGAMFSWSGNDKVGAGRQTIVESRPDELVQIKLEFERPFKDVCTAEFTFKPEGEQTNVTWSMYGTRNFMGKAFGLFIDCDKMVGGDFEKGLASMKAIVESPESKSEEPTKQVAEAEQTKEAVLAVGK